MNEKVRERLKGAPRFDTEQAALREAVKRAKADEDTNEMVMRQGSEYLVVGWQDWEIAMTAGGCKPVYGSWYIYDLAAGRNPSEKDNQAEIEAIVGTKQVKKAMTYRQAREKR